jgi:hypothetical protein
MRESTKKEEDWDPVSETSMVSGEERSQVETVVRALVWGGESTSFKEISSRRHKGTKCPKQLKKARGA